MQCKCLCCNKNYQHKFDEILKERFFNTYKFSNHDSNKFILLLWKGVNLYKYMDAWEYFNETLLPEKGDFYSHLNIKDITDADYAHAKRVCKDFKIKKLGAHHDLYVQSDTLLLANEFENFRNMFFWNIQAWSCWSFSPWISMVGSFKKTKVKLDLLTDIEYY